MKQASRAGGHDAAPTGATCTRNPEGTPLSRVPPLRWATSREPAEMLNASTLTPAAEHLEMRMASWLTAGVSRGGLATDGGFNQGEGAR